MAMRKGKTAVAIALALAILLALCACSGGGKEAAGYYRMTKLLESGEENQEISQMAEIGIYMYLVLNEDGTGYMDNMGEKDEIKWDEKELWDDESDPSSYTYANGTIILQSDGDEMVYTRLTDEELAYYKEHGSEVDWDALMQDEKAMSILFGGVSSEPVSEPDDASSSFTLGGGGQKSEIADGAVSTGPVTADIDDFTVTILSSEIVTADNGEPAMRFWYDFTNNADELASVFYDLSWECAQDGETVEQAYLYEDVAEAQNSSLMVAPGYTIRCVSLYAFDPDGGPVAFQLSGYYGDSVTYYADPTDPGGAPADPFEMKRDGSVPSFMEGAPKTDGSVEILGADKAEDYYGDEALRVRFRYTNQTDEEDNCFINYYIYAIQDGYELPYAFTDGEDEDEDNDMEDIAPGESIEFTTYWTPRTDSPVTIAIKEGWGDTEYFGDVLELD